jgi:hypothetical protein
VQVGEDDLERLAAVDRVDPDRDAAAVVLTVTVSSACTVTVTRSQ